MAKNTMAVNIDKRLYKKLRNKAIRERKVTYKMIEELLANAIGYTLPLNYEDEDEDENELTEAKKTEEKQLEEMSV